MEMLRFGNVALDVDRALLRDSNGAEVALRPKSLDLLLDARAQSRPHDVARRAVRRRLARRDGHRGQYRSVRTRGSARDRRPRGANPAHDRQARLLPGHRGSIRPVDARRRSLRGASRLTEGRPSLVVLPFQSIPYDPDTEWFADGIVEEITTALSRFRSLFVIARNSAFTFKGQAVDVRDVGQRLGVRYVLEGSVRRALGQLRVTGQLVEAETGNHVWAERYDGVMSDVFELQDQITAAVAGVLEPSIRRAEMNRAVRKPTSDLTVYDLYLRALPGMYAWSKVGYELAKSLLEEAVARDPNFAQVRGMLAVLWEFGVYFGWEYGH